MLEFFIAKKQLEELITAKKTYGPLFAANISFHIEFKETGIVYKRCSN